VELDQDRPLADFVGGVGVLLVHTFDYVHCHLGEDVVWRHVVPVGTQLRVGAPVQHNAAVGVAYGLVHGAVRHTARVEGLQRSREGSRVPLHKVAPRLRLGENIVVHGDLPADVGQHLPCVINRCRCHINYS
jgi:hypothetical protein